VHLGDQLLWQDEAQTALLAESIQSHGIPLGSDGKNSFSQYYGKDYGKGTVWKYHPWLPFYLCALSFTLFGKSAWSARLPFALLGLATILLLYAFGHRLYRQLRIGATAAVLLALSVPFLLLSRQCRYYSAACFFTLLALYADLRRNQEGLRPAGHFGE